MAKPVSSAHELGRAIGYKVDVESLIEVLSPMRINDAAIHQAIIEQIGRAVENQNFSGKSNRMWIVLKIERGIPVMLDAYRDKRSATKRERFLRQHMRPEHDQVQLVEVKV